MTPFFDTIVAPITGVESAAVAWIRASGPAAVRIAHQVFEPLPDPPVMRHAYYGQFAHGDDGILILFPEGGSFTGEATAEMSVHGSRASVRALLAACVRAGARVARPGEFTERAFLNGRLDLTAAEGVRDTVEAATSTQLRLANAMRQGGLRQEVAALREEVFAALATVEASIDFSEEVGSLDRPAMSARLSRMIREVDNLLATSELGHIVRSGLRIALVGRPNVGKSSLLNALVGAERAIVTATPGTTRDYLAESVELGGVPCVLLDTAGLRDTQDEAERMGVERSETQAKGADLVWHIVDATEAFDPEEHARIANWGRPTWVVINKVDLAQPKNLKGFAISAKTREGIPALVEAVQTWTGIPAEDRWIAVNPRHAGHLEAVREALSGALVALDSTISDDLIAVPLQEAALELGHITGETAMPDMVERIFRDFCIGK